MKTEFTTGQWHFRTGMSDNFCEIIGDYKTNKVIAVAPKDCFIEEDEATANGRLIAAAPELLKVCMGILEDDQRKGILLGRDRVELKNAIRKATE